MGELTAMVKHHNLHPEISGVGLTVVMLLTYLVRRPQVCISNTLLSSETSF
jgi:hypothetical protein